MKMKMRRLRRDGPVALALILATLTSSCGIFNILLFRKRPPVVRHGKTGVTLMTASQDDLVTRLNTIYGAINSFQATVEMTPSVGSVYGKGEINEIPDVRAFIFFRKPADIRIQAQTPVVRTQAFDMASNGQMFHLFLNRQNIFYEGTNNAPKTSKNQFENLRPEVFLNSMLIRPPENGEIPALTDLTDSENAFYVIQLIRKLDDGGIQVARQVWFDRVDLTISRQMVFNEKGSILSDTRYNNWQAYGGVQFPSHIDISRPIDSFGAVLDIAEMQMNKALTDVQFALTQPEGSKLEVIGTPKQANP